MSSSHARHMINFERNFSIISLSCSSLSNSLGKKKKSNCQGKKKKKKIKLTCKAHRDGVQVPPTCKFCSSLIYIVMDSYGVRESHMYFWRVINLLCFLLLLFFFNPCFLICFFILPIFLSLLMLVYMQ